MARVRGMSLLDVTLNVIFVAYVFYVIATGSFVPAPFLRDQPDANVIDLQQPAEDAPPPLLIPIEPPEEL
jgi:hypothetical protein